MKLSLRGSELPRTNDRADHHRVASGPEQEFSRRATATAVGKGRLTPLDGVRALAFLTVFGLHVGIRQMPGGSVGVDVFFTLSGFLITGLLLTDLEQSGRIRLRRFYSRRLARLAPALVIMVGVFALYATFGLRHTPALRHHSLVGVPVALLYATNWWNALVPHGTVGFFDHTWSLAIEEQFYLCWPVVLWGGYRLWQRRGVLTLALLGVTWSLIERILLWNGMSSAARIQNGTDTNADQLLIGAALAVLVLGWPVQTRKAVRLLGLPAMVYVGWIIGSHPHHAFDLRWGLSLVALASGSMIGYVVTTPTGVVGRFLSLRPLAYTGRISYGLYLWHYPLTLVVAPSLHSIPERAAAIFVLSFVVAAASWELVERPILGWRDRRRCS